MALNPNSDARQRSAAAIRAGSPFQADAAAAVDAFHALQSDLETQVRTGRLTPRVARERAAQAAADMRDDLARRASEFRQTPAALSDRVAATLEKRRYDGARPSFGALQRETNRLLRQNLMEQQLASRAAEFQARAFHRPLGGGVPAPTLDSLLAFAAQADAAADESAREWARRQLESFRAFVHTADDLRRIDAACDRPDEVNPRTVARYLEALAEASGEELDRFASEALQTRDASACVAAVLLAGGQGNIGGELTPWVQTLLDGLDSLPDAALTTIRSHLAAERDAESRAAVAAAEAASARIAAEARMPHLVAPSDAQIARMARAEARPLADVAQPIGLAPAFRGRTPSEIASYSEDATA